MIKILITGAAGNIGSALVERLFTFTDYYIVAVDNFLTGNQTKLPDAEQPNFMFIKADVNNYAEISSIMLSYKFDFVFHYAALVGVQRTLENPIMVLNDIQGIKNILDLSKNTGVKRVYYSSSSEVYGEPLEYPQNERTTPLNSRLPYAIVKNVGEAFLRSYHKEFDLSYTIFRFFNTYGPRQSEDFVVTKFIKQATRNEPLTIYGMGSQTRTFCYIEDNIDTTIACLRKELCVNDVMNVGSDEEITVKVLASKIIQVTDSASKIVYLPALKEGDMSRRKPDITKMKAILGRPLISLEDGLKRTLNKRMFY
ncbi:MAG: NAD-dependent epimerase/dehydratase family protein [Bacteroidota bacterium]